MRCPSTWSRVVHRRSGSLHLISPVAWSTARNSAAPEWRPCDSVQDPILGYDIAEVGRQALVPPPVLPDDFVATGLDPQQRTAAAVGFGDEHRVVDDHRVGGIDALQRAGAPREVEVDGPVGRVEADEASAGEHEAPAPVVNRRDHGAGVAGELIAERIADFTGRLGERNDPRAVARNLARVDPAAAWRATAHHRDQKIALDDRRAARTEEVLHDAETLGGSDLPEHAAVGHVVGAERALDAKGEYSLAVHHRRGAWAATVAVEVLVYGGVLAPPHLGTGLGIQANQPSLAIVVIEKEQPPLGHHRAGVALPSDVLPNQRRT